MTIPKITTSTSCKIFPLGLQASPNAVSSWKNKVAVQGSALASKPPLSARQNVSAAWTRSLWNRATDAFQARRHAAIGTLLGASSFLASARAFAGDESGSSDNLLPTAIGIGAVFLLAVAYGTSGRNQGNCNPAAPFEWPAENPVNRQPHDKKAEFVRDRMGHVLAPYKKAGHILAGGIPIQSSCEFLIIYRQGTPQSILDNVKSLIYSEMGNYGFMNAHTFKIEMRPGNPIQKP